MAHGCATRGCFCVAPVFFSYLGINQKHGLASGSGSSATMSKGSQTLDIGTSSLPSKQQRSPLAVLDDAKARGPLPLARDRAAVLASERKDLQAVVQLVTDEQLLTDHRQPTRAIEQRLPKPVAKLHRVGVEGDDLVPRLMLLELIPIVSLVYVVDNVHAEEKPTGREHGAVSVIIKTIRVLAYIVGCQLNAVVSEPLMLSIVNRADVNRLLVGDDVSGDFIVTFGYNMVTVEPEHTTSFSSSPGIAAIP
eukprot:scaffold20281_cov48-Phaeocystis_antarctica.AAC.3